MASPSHTNRAYISRCMIVNASCSLHMHRHYMLWRSILLALMWCSHVNSSKWGEALDDFAASAAGTAASLEYCLLRTAAHALYCNPGKLPPNDAKFLGFLFSSLPLSTAVQQQKREGKKKKACSGTPTYSSSFLARYHRGTSRNPSRVPSHHSRRPQPPLTDPT